MSLLLRRSVPRLARVYGDTSCFLPGSSGSSCAALSFSSAATAGADAVAATRVSQSPPPLHGKKQRSGSLHAIAHDTTYDDKKLRQQLNELLADERDPLRALRANWRGRHARGNGSADAYTSSSNGTGGGGYAQRKLVDLPGVERVRDLPADPITRLFFQHKGDHALYYGTYDSPSAQDDDRVQIANRTAAPHAWRHGLRLPVYDFCHRLREASAQRKRFVVVPATHETRGCARVLLDHGLVAGFRDFHNDRAFVVELKYFQNEPTLRLIEPCSYDGRTEFEWSPKMMRRLLNSHGIHNRLIVYICRTADNRVIDHIQAVRECVGGRGLLMAH